jgi:hypothetical protein
VKNWCLISMLIGSSALKGYSYRFSNEAATDLIVRLHFAGCSRTLYRQVTVANTEEVDTSGRLIGCAVDSLTAQDMSGNKVADAGNIGVGNKDFVIKPAEEGANRYKFVEL